MLYCYYLFIITKPQTSYTELKYQNLGYLGFRRFILNKCFILRRFILCPPVTDQHLSKSNCVSHKQSCTLSAQYEINSRRQFFFIFLSQLPGKLNELDNNGDLALDLALSRKLESIATTLVNNKADVDMVDQSGWSLLHKAIQRGECQ